MTDTLLIYCPFYGVHYTEIQRLQLQLHTQQQPSSAMSSTASASQLPRDASRLSSRSIQTWGANDSSPAASHAAPAPTQGKQKEAELNKPEQQQMDQLQQQLQELQRLQRLQPQPQPQQQDKKTAEQVQVDTLTGYLDAFSELWYTEVSKMLPHIEREADKQSFLKIIIGSCIHDIQYQNNKLTLLYKNKQNPARIDSLDVPVIANLDSSNCVTALRKLVVLKSTIHTFFKPQSNDAQLACTGIIKDKIQQHYCYAKGNKSLLKNDLTLPEVKAIITRFNLIAELNGVIVMSDESSNIRFDQIQRECISQILQMPDRSTTGRAELPQQRAVEQKAAQQEIVRLRQEVDALRASSAQEPAIAQQLSMQKTAHESKRAEVEQQLSATTHQLSEAQTELRALKTYKVGDRVLYPSDGNDGAYKTAQIIEINGDNATLQRDSGKPKIVKLADLIKR